MARAEREQVALHIFGDPSFRAADPKTRLEMGRVRLYQQTGILVGSPAERIESQGKVVLGMIDRVRGLIDDFVVASTPQQPK